MSNQVEFHEDSSEDEDSTTSTSWQEKLKLPAEIQKDGEYLIKFYCEIRTNSTSADCNVRVQVDDTDTDAEFSYEPEGTADWKICNGKIKKALSTGSREIDIDYARSGGFFSSAYIRRARLFVERMN